MISGVKKANMELLVKSPPANAGATGDRHLIPGLEGAPGEGHAVHSSVPAWRVPSTGEPGRLQSIGSQRT